MFKRLNKVTLAGKIYSHAESVQGQLKAQEVTAWNELLHA